VRLPHDDRMFDVEPVHRRHPPKFMTATACVGGAILDRPALLWHVYGRAT
jgi:hypothetical protein